MPASQAQDGDGARAAAGAVHQQLQGRSRTPSRASCASTSSTTQTERPVITGIERVSTPGRRVYVGKAPDSRGAWAAWAPRSCHTSRADDRHERPARRASAASRLRRSGRGRAMSPSRQEAGRHSRRGVTVDVRRTRSVRVKGPKGELAYPLVARRRRGGRRRRASWSARSERRHAGPALRHDARADREHGRGVTAGFSKTLEIVGTGYRAQMERQEPGAPARLLAPDRVRAARGHHDQGRDPDQGDRSAASTRSWSARSRRTSADSGPPEPYKGKGIKYEGRVRPTQGRQGGGRRRQS